MFGQDVLVRWCKRLAIRFCWCRGSSKSCLFLHLFMSEQTMHEHNPTLLFGYLLSAVGFKKTNDWENAHAPTEMCPLFHDPFSFLGSNAVNSSGMQLKFDYGLCKGHAIPCHDSAWHAMAFGSHVFLNFCTCKVMFGTPTGTSNSIMIWALPPLFSLVIALA